MGICKKCGKESGEYPLCKECYKNNTEPEEFTQHSIKKTSYPEEVIKGRIAEALIEELFLSLRYNVFRYGMENTVPGITKLLRGIRSDVANNIRKMPDFVVQDKNNEVYFVEVKFRKDEEFSINDLKEKTEGEYPYENAYFILVSKRHIKCITYKELKQGKSITPEDRKYLGNRKEFELDKNRIIEFCNFAVKFFENVD